MANILARYSARNLARARHWLCVVVRAGQVSRVEFLATAATDQTKDQPAHVTVKLPLRRRREQGDPRTGGHKFHRGLSTLHFLHHVGMKAGVVAKMHEPVIIDWCSRPGEEDEWFRRQIHQPQDTPDEPQGGVSG